MICHQWIYFFEYDRFIYKQFWIKYVEMYTLLHGLYKYLVQKDEYFILILGLDNAGKTVRYQKSY